MSSLNSNNNHIELKKRLELINEMQFLGQMASTETALFHQKAAELFGLSITDMKAISTLMQEGPMTAGQIANRLSLTTGAVTSVIDRLEAVKAVKRHSDPKDRRKVIVKVIPENFDKEGGKVYESMGRSFAKLLQSYTTDQIEFLVEYYKTSIEITKQEITKIHSKK